MLPDRWRHFVLDVERVLTEYHAAYPDVQGIGRERLRMMLLPMLPAAVFVVALQRVSQDGRVLLDGAFVRLAAHTARLTPADEVAWTAMVPLLGGEVRFRPPRVRDIAGVTGRSEGDVRRLLKLAGRMGWADEVAHDHFFLRVTLREMVGIVLALTEAVPGGRFTAAQFRDRVANGRKVAIQILEFFDRHGVTVNREELRRIDPQRLDLFGQPMLSSAMRSSPDGGESSLVGRSDFKSEWGSQTVPGGFDSRSPPPLSR